MQNSKFFKNERNSYQHQQPFSNSPFGFTALELYPQRRQTEFYYQPSIPQEFQSRSFEHPPNLDDHNHIWGEEYKREKIVAPRSSDSRIFRDSYFS